MSFKTINDCISKINKLDNDLSEIFLMNIVSFKNSTYNKDDYIIKDIINEISNRFDKYNLNYNEKILDLIYDITSQIKITNNNFYKFVKKVVKKIYLNLKIAEIKFNYEEFYKLNNEELINKITFINNSFKINQKINDKIMFQIKYKTPSSYNIKYYDICQKNIFNILIKINNICKQIQLDAFNYLLNNNHIQINNNILKNINSIINNYKNYLIITDKNIFNIYSHDINKYNNLILDNFGEELKTQNYVDYILNYLSSNHFNKNDLIIALGGGVVGDIVGYVSSIYKRGINFIQIPTTLLAMVDSSIGGKNGINNKFGKNQIGTICMPKNIFIDINFLKTLELDEIKNGFAEIIKTAIVSSKDLWNILTLNSLDIIINNKLLLENIILKCAMLKYGIISEDLLEKKSIRDILNFGHTIGHAIESITKQKHGFCVSLGMTRELLLKDKNNKYLTPTLLREEIINTLKNYGLPTQINENININDMLYYISNDKKGNKIIGIKDIGEPLIIYFDNKTIINIISNNLILNYKNNINQINDHIINEFIVPPSKSETNRLLLMGAISQYESVKLLNCLISEDTIIMINALKILGIELKILNKTNKSFDVILNGCNYNFPNKKCNLYFGNSGTTTRFLIPILSIQKGNIDYKINCDERMKKRPQNDLLNCLKNIGCKYIFLENDNCLPINIKKNNYNINNEIKVNCSVSSQFVTGLLIAFNDNCCINIGKDIVSFEFIKLTIQLLKYFNKYIEIDKINNDNKILKINNKEIIEKNIEINVNPDATSASYPIIYSLLNKKNIFIPNFNKNIYQGDIKYCIDVIKKFGGNIIEKENGLYIYGSESNELKGIGKINFDSSDTFLSFAILAAFSKGVTEIYNIDNQEVKECNRITVIYNILKECNIDIKKENNTLIINGLKNNILNNNIKINTQNDHRIAMSSALLYSKINNITINNYNCVNKTYPTFWEDMDKIGLVFS